MPNSQQISETMVAKWENILTETMSLKKLLNDIKSEQESGASSQEFGRTWEKWGSARTNEVLEDIKKTEDEELRVNVLLPLFKVLELAIKIRQAETDEKVQPLFAEINTLYGTINSFLDSVRNNVLEAGAIGLTVRLLWEIFAELYKFGEYIFGGGGNNNGGGGSSSSGNTDSNPPNPNPNEEVPNRNQPENQRLIILAGILGIIILPLILIAAINSRTTQNTQRQQTETIVAIIAQPTNIQETITALDLSFNATSTEGAKEFMFALATKNEAAENQQRLATLQAEATEMATSRPATATQEYLNILTEQAEAVARAEFERDKQASTAEATRFQATQVSLQTTQDSLQITQTAYNTPLPPTPLPTDTPLPSPTPTPQPLRQSRISNEPMRFTLSSSNRYTLMLTANVSRTRNGEFNRYVISSSELAITEDTFVYELRSIGTDETDSKLAPFDVQTLPDRLILSYILPEGQYEFELKLSEQYQSDNLELSISLNNTASIVGCEMDVKLSQDTSGGVRVYDEPDGKQINNNNTLRMDNNAVVNAISRSQDGNWYQIDYIGSGGEETGWVNARNLGCRESCVFPTCPG